jgi:hypothetical protein
MEALDRPAWNPSRQCAGTNREGHRCQRNAIPGGDVCVMHGGAAPQVQKSAKARLLAGADLAIDYLLNLLTPRPPCEHCGRSDADRDPVVVRACQLVLDRSGFHPTLVVVQAPPAANPYADLSDAETLEQAEATLARCQRMVDLLRSARQPDAQDAVLLDSYEVPEDEGEPAANDPNPLGNGTPEKGTTDDEGAK